MSRYLSALPPLRLLPLNFSHCVSHDEFQHSVVSVKQPLFHLVFSKYPRALSCSISKYRSYLFSTPFSPFSNRLELYTPVLSFPRHSFLFTHLVRYIPIIFSLFRRLGITGSPRGEDVPRGRGRSIEYRLRSIWNARNEGGWSRQSCVRYDVSTEKTVNSTRRWIGGGREVTEGISNRKEFSDTLGYDTTRMVSVWSSGESNLLVVNRLHGTLCFRRRTFLRRIMTIAVYIRSLHLRHNNFDCSFPFF